MHRATHSASSESDRFGGGHHQQQQPLSLVNSHHDNVATSTNNSGAFPNHYAIAMTDPRMQHPGLNYILPYLRTSTQAAAGYTPASSSAAMDTSSDNILSQFGHSGQASIATLRSGMNNMINSDPAIYPEPSLDARLATQSLPQLAVDPFQNDIDGNRSYDISGHHRQRYQPGSSSGAAGCGSIGYDVGQGLCSCGIVQ